MHANAYKLRPDVNFVVHTHQFYASAICAEEFSITLSDGSFVPCIEYGLPSTKKLTNNCAKAFKQFKNSDIFLLAKHGVATFGTTMKEALNNAEFDAQLEKEDTGFDETTIEEMDEAKVEEVDTITDSKPEVEEVVEEKTEVIEEVKEVEEEVVVERKNLVNHLLQNQNINLNLKI